MSSRFPVPSWAKRCIGYQCFIDSFANSQVDIQQKKEKYNRAVYGDQAYCLEWEAKDDAYHFGKGFYGGDLAGVDYTVRNYLKDLGIDMLYLTPFFEAESNHKYDTIDYKKVDPQFGSTEDFEHLVQSCREENIRLIIDGVFNHTSSNHPWHQKAITGEEHYLNLYKRNKDGFIKHWEGVQTMPLLNHTNEDVRNYFYAGENNVIDYWIKAGADGWRLDVAERLGKRALKDIQKSLKSKHDQALLIGEVVESYGQEWLADDLMDGLMNYVFRGVTVKYLTNNIDASEYLYELSKMYDDYPKEKLFASWNIISTHDTNRMLYDVKGDEGLFKMAVVLQFTYPGVPMIYYGDELGMQSGKKEVSNRMGMDWETVKQGKKKQAGYGDPMEWQKTERYNSFHDFYKHMIWIRKNHEALVEGAFVKIEINHEVCAYMRLTDDQKMLILVNVGQNQEINGVLPEQAGFETIEMKCLYGQNDPLKIENRKIKFYANGKNSYIFVG